jgi:predicted lipid-binding transport protein (Tim44 family)
MKWKIVLSIVALTVATRATADEHRGGDAALGALSGAVVLGPIGAVAGAVVGYTAGPSIAHAWGFRRGNTAHQRARPAKQEAQVSAAPAQVTPASATTAATPQARPAASARTASSKPPPVQGLE